MFGSKGAIRSLVLVAAVVAMLVASKAVAAEPDDFDELPLAPLVPPEFSGEGEGPADDLAEEEEMLTDGISLQPDTSDRPAAWESSAGAATSPNALLLKLGGYMPLHDSFVLGPRLGLVLERLLMGEMLRARAQASFASLRLSGPQVIRGRGLDAGFEEVANLVEAGIAMAWHPLLGSSSLDPFTYAGVGVALSVSDSRVFSADRRSMALLPTLVVGAGLDVRAGPGKLRFESTLGFLDVAFGPEDSPVLRAKAGIGLGVAYRLSM